mmetsp:Transcript_41831/g.98170  ORF Transcript_41831/g.98170 Transcript_41831/m.98170 type:complete len:276 (+) Transcript_41831:1049-1876(+)
MTLLPVPTPVITSIREGSIPLPFAMVTKSGSSTRLPSRSSYSMRWPSSLGCRASILTPPLPLPLPLPTEAAAAVATLAAAAAVAAATAAMEAAVGVPRAARAGRVAGGGTTSVRGTGCPASIHPSTVLDAAAAAAAATRDAAAAMTSAARAATASARTAAARSAAERSLTACARSAAARCVATRSASSAAAATAATAGLPWRMAAAMAAAAASSALRCCAVNLVSCSCHQRAALWSSKTPSSNRTACTISSFSSVWPITKLTPLVPVSLSLMRYS